MEMLYTDGMKGKEIKPRKPREAAMPSANSVIEALRPLAEFYRVNRKKIDRIAVDGAQWRRIQLMADDPKEARIYRHMDGYPMYGAYELYRADK
jgi:hypothetical protein